MILTPEDPQVKQLLQSAKTSSNETLYQARADGPDYNLVLQVDGKRHSMQLNEEKSHGNNYVYEARV